ncbi:MAG: BON domain-containing protein [Usitatibacter sp.]
MAIIEFMKEAGESILDRRTGKVSRNVSGQQQQQSSSESGGAQQGGYAEPSAARRPVGKSREASHALLQYIRLQDALDVPDDLMVVFDVDDGLVSLDGTAPDQETRELIVLLAGNVAGVEAVDDDMTTAKPGAASPLHIVKEGETAASIAREHYGDEKLARRIMDANRPVLRYSRDVRPGLTLRLPRFGHPS